MNKKSRKAYRYEEKIYINITNYAEELSIMRAASLLTTLNSLRKNTLPGLYILCAKKKEKKNMQLNKG